MESFWLPPGTEGNGLSATRWTELLVVSRSYAVRLLAAFRAAGIPARMASRRHSTADRAETRVWVDPDRYAEAENIALRERN